MMPFFTLTNSLLLSNCSDKIGSKGCDKNKKCLLAAADSLLVACSLRLWRNSKSSVFPASLSINLTTSSARIKILSILSFSHILPFQIYHESSSWQYLTLSLYNLANLAALPDSVRLFIFSICLFPRWLIYTPFSPYVIVPFLVRSLNKLLCSAFDLNRHV